ncbi:hypothetical protein HPB49_003459 [Dermacentor silvarum]|uniref:Uncharacterized protein n=1 Tax=Dermacentor silvarum TaxID=543639 RepID=A0ACB8CV56_DERSI|nr:hypothetical protein HPB49_003459 [Dermacentor silvarum]
MAYSVLHDELLLRSLHWDEIEDMHLLPMEPRRFQKSDLDDLMTGLLIPEEVESAQRVRIPGREALCMTLRRLAYPNRLPFTGEVLHWKTAGPSLMAQHEEFAGLQLGSRTISPDTNAITFKSFKP